MISEARIKLLAQYFSYPIKYIRHFVSHEPAQDKQFTRVRFLMLGEKLRTDIGYVEYCLITRKGRFMRLLDEVTSSVDIREAADYIDSVEPADIELEIIWDEQLTTKQYYLIRDYCPPLYCGNKQS